MKNVPIALLLTSALLLAQDEQPSGPRPPEVGDPAPAFRLNDQDGKLVSIGGESEYGLWTVVAFYPKAMTPG
jgi:hypothetical protein